MCATLACADQVFTGLGKFGGGLVFTEGITGAVDKLPKSGPGAHAVMRAFIGGFAARSDVVERLANPDYLQIASG